MQSKYLDENFELLVYNFSSIRQAKEECFCFFRISVLHLTKNE
jgi:hypothetical protein